MTYRVLSLLLLGLALGGLCSSSRVRAQDRSPLPSQRYSTLRPTAALSLETLPRTNGDSLRAAARQETDRVGPYAYGTHLDADFTPAQHGTWEQLPSGDWVWRLRLQSRDAVSLSLGFEPFRLPSGAKLYLHGPDERQIRGPYTAADATRNQLWTPIIQSEVITIELTVPHKRRNAVNLKVSTVVHGYRSLDAARDDGLRRKSGTCNLDVACEEADPWRNQVRSVGGYTFGREDQHLICSGALVNNTAEDGTPYFLTAEHCVQTPDDAASMMFYWNFQTATCREQGTDANGTFPSDTLSVENWRQTSTGALLRARYGNWHSQGQIAGKSDLALVEVDDSIPDGYNLYLSGWSRTGNTTSESVTIHHPSGHGKRISFDRNPSSLVDYPTTRTCSAPPGDTHLLIQNWETGTTERGSSGAPLFDMNRHIVGVLSGGCAGCGGDGDADDNNAPDWYGRIAPGFMNGDYTPPGKSQPTTLADVLDPINTGQATLDGRNFRRDTLPPAPVPSFSVADVTPDSVTLQWKATGDDGLKGTATRYELQFRPASPIQTLSDFRSARAVSGLPRPKTARTRQSVTVAVNRDTSYYFAIRALDDANLASPIVSIDRDVTPVSALRVTTPPFPTPARRHVTTRFVTRKDQTVFIGLYDTLGRQVKVLLRERVAPFRRRTVRTDVSDLSSGMYFLRIRGASAARTERIVVVK